MKFPALTTKAFIAGIMGMLSTPDKRFRLTPTVNIPSREAVEDHKQRNPSWKRRKLEVHKRLQHQQ